MSPISWTMSVHELPHPYILVFDFSLFIIFHIMYYFRIEKCFFFALENNQQNVKFTNVKIMNGNKFRVRVLLDNQKHEEFVRANLTYSDALDWFRFYVNCTLEFNLSVRCINIFLGKRSIKLFQNH